MGDCLLLVPAVSVMAGMLTELLRKPDGSLVTLWRCRWQKSDRTDSMQAGMWLFLSWERLWTGAKKQAQKEVPETGHATAGQMIPCVLVNEASRIPTQTGHQQETDAPFCHFHQYESFL